MHKVNAEWRIVFCFETYGTFYMVDGAKNTAMYLYIGESA